MAASVSLVVAVERALALARSAEPDGGGLCAALEQAKALAEEQARHLSSAERELNRLTNRYIAHQRLFEDLRLEKICDALADVVVNLLGSEDFVVFLGDNDGHLYPVRGMGPSDRDAAAIDAEDPLTVIGRGPRAVFDHHGWSALAPLPDTKGTPRGLLAIRSLLRHKPSFTADDRDALEELRLQAGRAIGFMLNQIESTR